MMTRTPLRTRKAIRSPLDVLVADDEPADKLLVALAAGEAATEIRFSFVDDGEQLLVALAKRIADGNPPDVVVLDLRMPRCSGLEALERLAESNTAREIPIVMFTNSRRQSDMDRAIELGVVRFQTKPASYTELVEFIDELGRIVAEARARQPLDWSAEDGEGL